MIWSGSDQLFTDPIVWYSPKHCKRHKWFQRLRNALWIKAKQGTLSKETSIFFFQCFNRYILI